MLLWGDTGEVDFKPRRPLPLKRDPSVVDFFKITLRLKVLS